MPKYKIKDVTHKLDRGELEARDLAAAVRFVCYGYALYVNGDCDEVEFKVTDEQGVTRVVFAEAERSVTWSLHDLNGAPVR